MKTTDTEAPFYENIDYLECPKCTEILDDDSVFCPNCSEQHPACVIWDWKETPPWSEINKLLAKYNVCIKKLEDDSDSCMIAVMQNKVS